MTELFDHDRLDTREFAGTQPADIAEEAAELADRELGEAD